MAQVNPFLERNQKKMVSFIDELSVCTISVTWNWLSECSCFGVDANATVGIGS